MTITDAPARSSAFRSPTPTESSRRSTRSARPGISPVTGSIPDELDGVFLRNGPNPPPVPFEGTYHWFLPDGMIHGVKLSGGRPIWYRNRWVRTDALAAKLGTSAATGPDDVALIRTHRTRPLLPMPAGCCRSLSTACPTRWTPS